jgi:ketosteroid isomerase-like protein
MTTTEEENLATVRQYLSALQEGDAGAALKRFFAEDVRQIEFPNKLNPSGQESDLQDMLKRSERGLKVLQRQRYEIVSAIAQGIHVAVEARWVGVLAVPLQSLAVGAEMKAHFAMFFELNNGKITLQRNYDCFDPW